MDIDKVFSVSCVLLLFLSVFSVEKMGWGDGSDLNISRLGVHRGGKGVFPENTIFAYAESVRRWKNCLLEGDIRLTKDGVPVIIHDETVDRTTDGTGRVGEKTLEEIKMLDAGYRFTTDGGKTYPFRGKGIKIPTLEEVLKTFPNETFLFEIKVPLEDPSPVVNPILENKMERKVYLASVHTATIQRIRERYENVMTCFTIADAGPLVSALRNGNWENYQPPAEMLALSPNIEKHFGITLQEIEKIRQKGVKVVVFTVNSEELMKNYLSECKVDWILTDYPDRYEKLAVILNENR